VPRDIDTDVEQLNNVYLYNVDHLEAIVRENVRSREQELAGCRAIISARAAALMARFAPAREVSVKEATAAQADWSLAGVAACQS
jgi:glutamyl-tRNA reductase